MSHPLAVPERRGLRDDGAEDGGGAEEDEGAVHDGALPCLVVEMGGWVPRLPVSIPPSLQAQTKESGDLHTNGFGTVVARMVSGRFRAQVECMTWGRLCLSTCETPCERSSGMSFICARLEFDKVSRVACSAGWAGSAG